MSNESEINKIITPKEERVYAAQKLSLFGREESRTKTASRSYRTIPKVISKTPASDGRPKKLFTSFDFNASQTLKNNRQRAIEEAEQLLSPEAA